MSEPQYANYKDLPEQKLGLMSGEIWQRDPKMLGIHLARYKFVSKMLAGKKRVAEIGCGDGFYSEVVRREVGILDLYDFDRNIMPEDAIYLDINHSVLPATYDAIYALDVLEHIPVGSMALAYICQSLTEDGIFIAGMPSHESQQYASEASKIGHISCRSMEGFRFLLKGSFKNVFMFGMNDETLHTGFGPMCHYILGVACGVR